MWNDDEELFALMRSRLFPAVVGDILDTMGLLRQFLSPSIRPLRSDMVIAGRAMPVLETNCFAAVEPDGKLPLSRQPFGLMFQALDDLKPHEVYVATGCAPQFALWGGLMTTRALHLKAAGAILDGYSRDTPEVLHNSACRSSRSAGMRRTRVRAARSWTTGCRWRSTVCASNPATSCSATSTACW